jgi:hypothetical protein
MEKSAKKQQHTVIGDISLFFKWQSIWSEKENGKEKSSLIFFLRILFFP